MAANSEVRGSPGKGVARDMIPSKHEARIKYDTLKACEALLRDAADRLKLQERDAGFWRYYLQDSGYGRYDVGYIEEAIEQLDKKIGRTYCPICREKLHGVKTCPHCRYGT